MAALEVSPIATEPPAGSEAEMPQKVPPQADALDRIDAADVKATPDLAVEETAVVVAAPGPTAADQPSSLVTADDNLAAHDVHGEQTGDAETDKISEPLLAQLPSAGQEAALVELGDTGLTESQPDAASAGEVFARRTIAADSTATVDVAASQPVPHENSDSDIVDRAPATETDTGQADAAEGLADSGDKAAPQRLAAIIPAETPPEAITTDSEPQASADGWAGDEAGGEVGGDMALATRSGLQTAKLVPPPRTQSILGLGSQDRIEPSGEPPASLQQNRQTDFTASAQPPALSYQDELILEVSVKGVDASDTVIAYGTRNGVYLPLGSLARILDLAITVSDDGHFASGWVLDPERTLSFNLRSGTVFQNGIEKTLAADAAAAFDGEFYLLASRFSQFIPLEVKADLRLQAVVIETLEPFPFEERMAREAKRKRLERNRQGPARVEWPRQETPWLLASLPLADVELRAVSDDVFGPRAEADLFLAGDIALLTAEAFLSGDTVNGLTASLLRVGRMDPDGQLLGPLAATSFSVGDVSTYSMPLGLRGVAGRGFTVTNTPPEAFSVFERIDLRGILPEGYEVELYRNDILIGSTREAVNGRYEFIQVPVDFGLNVFRLVFFGPQGQRSEEVRRITVGDGRLSPGKFVYRLGAVEEGENVLGVRAPNFVPPRDFGDRRITAQFGYGLSSDITAVASAAWYETFEGDSWIGSAGIRSGIGPLAVKTDFALADDGAFAVSGGVSGRFGATSATLDHTEYSGEFRDETKSVTGEILRRATELDINTTLNLGNPVSGKTIPMSFRLRRSEGRDGSTQTNAAFRASTRFPGLLVSNTLEYSHASFPQIESRSQLFGNFDLATLARSKTRGRLSLGYQILPRTDLVNANLEVGHALDERTAIRASVNYNFQNGDTRAGLSAVRDFDRFTLAFDGNYGFRDDSYAIGMRLGFSFGRDPQRGTFFFARPGLASSGGASMRAFRDMDGDGVFGPGDSVLPEVDFVAFNQTVRTDDTGVARLAGLGSGRPVSVQVDTTSLPDIDLAPVRQGIEIVPRPGRIHSADFPIVALGEIEGTVIFHQPERSRGVSGVRIQLKDESGKTVGFAKTELDGYFFFERLKPGTYSLTLDPDQAAKLNLCARQDYNVTLGYEADLHKRDMDIALCD